jgi:exonuclease SbcC
MIGIITHVPALADRAPVRFVVARTGTSSTLRREMVS